MDFIGGAVVADPTHDRSLVFYSKSFQEWSRTARGTRQRVGASLAVWRNTETPADRPKVTAQREDPTLLFGADEPAWGNAALSRDGSLYAYACQRVEKELSMNCLLARVPLDRALERVAWQFYAGGGRWASDWHEARSVLSMDQVELFSVQWNQYLGKYLAVYRSVLNRWIDPHSSGRPAEGPWSEPVVEIQGLLLRSGPFDKIWMGLALGHPEIAREGGRVEYLTYFRNNDETRVVQIEFKRR